LRRSKTQVIRSDFPHGVCIRTENNTYYFINGKTRKPIKSHRVFKSWDFPLVINAHSSSLSSFVLSSPLGFRDGTLFRDVSDGKLYLVSNRLRRHITSPDALDMLGRKRSDAVWVSHDEVNLHKEGEEL
jgi:hypothetical protein